MIDGHWTVKWVAGVEVKEETPPWRVALQGAVSTRIDRGTYINCASPGCHGSGYIDADEQRWEGIPLYLVCGLVDDQRRHGEGAFNAHAARKGYTIEIETADGDVVRLDSRDVAGKRSIVLAGKLDGADLPHEYFPLRLVGPGLDEHVQVGRIGGSWCACDDAAREAARRRPARRRRRGACGGRMRRRAGLAEGA